MWPPGRTVRSRPSSPIARNFSQTFGIGQPWKLSVKAQNESAGNAVSAASAVRIANLDMLRAAAAAIPMEPICLTKSRRCCCDMNRLPCREPSRLKRRSGHECLSFLRVSADSLTLPASIFSADSHKQSIVLNDSTDVFWNGKD